MTSEWLLNIILISKKTKQHKQFFFTAQTSTNGAQTNMSILGEFGECWGAGDVIDPKIQYLIF